MRLEGHSQIGIIIPRPIIKGRSHYGDQLASWIRNYPDWIKGIRVKMYVHLLPSHAVLKYGLGFVVPVYT